MAGQPRHAGNFAAYLGRIYRAVASGGLMFISNATKYLGNGFFIAKMVLIGMAGLNMVVFHSSAREICRNGRMTQALPLSARLAGGLSILLWVAVVACGRWIGFTMRPG